MIELMIILVGLFGLGVVGGLERGLLGIGAALLLLAITAGTMAALVAVRKTVRRRGK